ncbi:protein adenylyltransferase SelO family protein [Mitsuaria sp. GD03876]|uniref:protein adenylyltransferase SelO family protein n=1 Tax=Mitsuaria sp. GD03876 TaxID=2975399 RepID=UPI00244AF410|nr:protein adenylyltransferase SelO family protein [Mitsuaria sp. GD03876]MDH0863931.1 protein adenylyltransferase SelO family protein [Mitsuaria sp. GD03876]
MHFELPRASFAAFPVTRLRAPKVLWTTPDRAAAAALPDSFWCVPHPDDDPAAFADERRLAFADKYGGRGVGANGGSGRSALDGPFQVKGIGRTPLIGESSDPDFAHGGLTLSEAVREAVWSEVYAAALPWGSVRSLAIVATGTTTFLESSRSTRSATRALLLRERAVRPAHFMRAPNFFPPGAGLRTHLEDVARTRDSVRALVECLHGESPGRPSAPRLVDVLLDTVHRFAAQIAAARAKRIPHGSLNCSNIAMDGRLIDFGTATALSDFGPAVTSVGKFPFWQEDQAMLLSLRNLVFTMSRYAGDPSGPEVARSGPRLVEAFHAALADRTAIELVKLTGRTEAEALAVPGALRQRFSDAALAVTPLHGAAPFLLDEMPRRMGGHGHLPMLLALLACAESPACAARELDAHGVSGPAIARLVDACFSLEDDARAEPAQRRSARRWRALNALRLAAPLPRLVRVQLARDITAELRGGAPDWQRFIDERVAHGAWALADTRPDEDAASRALWSHIQDETRPVDAGHRARVRAWKPAIDLARSLTRGTWPDGGPAS